MIKTAKVIDPRVIGIKALKNWQRLKVYEMSLVRYFEK